jgi:hypothetical protein
MKGPIGLIEAVRTGSARLDVRAGRVQDKKAPAKSGRSFTQIRRRTTPKAFAGVEVSLPPGYRTPTNRGWSPFWTTRDQSMSVRAEARGEIRPSSVLRPPPMIRQGPQRPFARPRILWGRGRAHVASLTALRHRYGDRADCGSPCG